VSRVPAASWNAPAASRSCDAAAARMRVCSGQEQVQQVAPSVRKCSSGAAAGEDAAGAGTGTPMGDTQLTPCVMAVQAGRARNLGMLLCRVLGCGPHQSRVVRGGHASVDAIRGSLSAG